MFHLAQLRAQLCFPKTAQRDISHNGKRKSHTHWITEIVKFFATSTTIGKRNG
jgi:hypothetical protein